MRRQPPATARLNPPARPPLSAVQRTEAQIIGKPLESAKQLAKEAFGHRGVRMFGRNTVASTIAFALDLAILWSLVELLDVPRVIAAVIAFVIPMVVFYFLSREWVFPGTRRGVGSGFVFFIANVGIGFVVMLAVFWGLLQFTGLYYLVARILASVVSGVVIFLLNGFLNFRQLGQGADKAATSEER